MSWIKEIAKEAKQNSSRESKQKQFGALVAFVMLIAFSYSYYQEGWTCSSKQQLFIGSGVCVVIITLIYKKIFYPLLIVWLFIGSILGKVSSFIIFSMIYYLLITPISILIKWTKKKTPAETGWIDKTNTIDYTKLH